MITYGMAITMRFIFGVRHWEQKEEKLMRMRIKHRVRHWELTFLLGGNRNCFFFLGGNVNDKLGGGNHDEVYIRGEALGMKRRKGFENNDQTSSEALGIDFFTGRQ